MNLLLLYLLEVSVAIGILFLLYWFLLRNETFYQLNRSILLANLILAFVIPMLVLPSTFDLFNGIKGSKSIAENYITENIDFEESPGFILVPVQKETTIKADTFRYLGIIYSIGLIFFIGRFLFQIGSLIKLIRRSSGEKINGYWLMNSKKGSGSFSFFNYVFFDFKQNENAMARSILAHELVHVREGHSIDIMFSEIVKIILWFNPFIWLYQRQIKLNLEYIADAKVLKYTSDKKSYQYYLLKAMMPKYKASLTNHFNHSQLKKRISMMNTKSSSQIAWIKYLLFLPVLFLLSLTLGNAQDPLPEIENGYNFSKGNFHEYLFGIITKDTDQKTLTEIKVLLETRGVKVEYSNLKFDAKGKISYLTLSVEDGKGNQGTATSTEGIQPIFFYKLEDEKSIRPFGIGVGMKYLDKTIPGDIKNKILKRNGGFECAYIPDNVEENFRASYTILQDRYHAKTEAPYILVDGKEVKEEDLVELGKSGKYDTEIVNINEAIKRYGQKAKYGALILTFKK